MEIKVDRLVAGLKFVKHAAAPDDLRPILATVLLEGTAQGLFLVAADNYRIARAHVDDQPCAEFGRRPLSVDEVPVVLAFLKGETAVTLTPAPKNRPFVVWSTGGARELSTRTVDGRWPDYVSVLPKQAKNKLVAVNPRLLAEALAASKTAKGITARMYVTDALSPFLVVSNDGDNEYVEAVMPLRTPDDDGWVDRLAEKPA
jgi:DNA polymerase III sliding clamp (beta) subunit (PCNA family)